MTPTPETPSAPDAAANTNVDTGLIALVISARIWGIPADFQQIMHELGGVKMGAPELVGALKQLGLKARAIDSTWERFLETTPPCIAQFRDGSFVPVGAITEKDISLQEPLAKLPRAMPHAEFQEKWSGQLILMTKRASLGNLAKDFNFSWFWSAMRKYRHWLVEVLVYSFFLQLCGLAMPLFFQNVIDKVLVHHSLSTLDVLVVGLVTVSVFETLLTVLRYYLLTDTTSKIDVELGAKLFQHLLALSISWFQKRRAGDSVARVRELETIRSFLTGTPLTLLIDLPFTVVFLAVMAYYSLFLTGIVLAAVPFLVAITAGVTPQFRALLKEKFDRGAENQSFLVEIINGIETIKALAIEPQMKKRWEEQLAGYVQASQRVVNLGNKASQSVQMVSKLITAAVLYFGAQAVIDGYMTVGELVAFNMLSQRVIQPVLRLAQSWQDFQQVKVSTERLGDILNSTPEPYNTPGRIAPPAIKGAITFEHFTFRYKLDEPARLSDINLDIPAGQVVGIVGSSGSGKSTLTKMIHCFHRPESGRLLVDGINLSMIDVSWLRRQIGVVMQDNTLFNLSIRENIAISQPGLPMDQIEQAARLAGAHDFILDLPHGYNTMVGERGSSLSGGQKQRIAIARGLINNPRILIFDEATSALDYESESIIKQNMSEIVEGRTVIIIAHRLTAVRHCDRIITLEKGRIVEDGTHDVLSKSDGRYASLLRIQGG